MRWPEIPQNLGELDAPALRQLARDIRAAMRTLSAESPTMSREDSERWHSFIDLAARLVTMATVLESEAADAAAEEAAAAAAAAAESEAAAASEGGDGEGEGSGDGDGADDAEGGDGGTDDGDGGGGAAADGGRQLSVVGSGIALASTIQVHERPQTHWIGQRGDFRNQELDGLQLAEAVGEAAAAHPTEKITVAKLFRDVPAARDLALGRDFENYAKIQGVTRGGLDELTAAMCAPLTPLYDLACANVVRRPVASGLPNFRLRADRGGFTVYPSPSLSDITTGYGQWTAEHDLDPEAIKACQTIECAESVPYEIYGVYRCLTVKNLVALTFRELVDAYLNRLQAAWARFAETLLLEAMANESTSIDAQPALYSAFGANTSLMRVILTYLGLYQEIERWDVEGIEIDAWMPRWLLFALKMDEASRRRTDGGSNRVPTTEAINAMFRNAGVEPHWFMDRPSWATPLNPLATAGDLNFFPSQVEILIHPRGKFAFMDRGELNIGIAPAARSGTQIEEDLRRNQHTFFFESFEGVINTDSCPAHLITVPGLCYNGVQIADNPGGCSGADQAYGFGSVAPAAD